MKVRYILECVCHELTSGAFSILSEVFVVPVSQLAAGTGVELLEPFVIMISIPLIWNTKGLSSEAKRQKQREWRFFKRYIRVGRVVVHHLALFGSIRFEPLSWRRRVCKSKKKKNSIADYRFEVSSIVSGYPIGGIHGYPLVSFIFVTDRKSPAHVSK